MYALNIGENISTVLGKYDPKEQLKNCEKFSIRGEITENDHTLVKNDHNFQNLQNHWILDLLAKNEYQCLR